MEELDDATKQRLAEEVERLVSMGMGRKQARRVVWDDYQDELAAYAVLVRVEREPPPTESASLETPVPEPPSVPPGTGKPFWQVDKTPFFTADRLAANKARLAEVKRLLRSA